MQPFVRVSEDDYLARETLAVCKSELVNGQVVAMSGASPRHNGIVRNLIFTLTGRLRGKPCQPFPSDLRIHVPSTGMYTYPDVSVVCGAPVRHTKDGSTIVNPRLLIEVLSDTTEAYDRGSKFAHYRTIATLETYVLVSQQEQRVEWYERGQDGVWTLHEAVGDGSTVTLRSIETTFSTADLYVDLPDAELP